MEMQPEKQEDLQKKKQGNQKRELQAPCFMMKQQHPQSHSQRSTKKAQAEQNGLGNPVCMAVRPALIDAAKGKSGNIDSGKNGDASQQIPDLHKKIFCLYYSGAEQKKQSKTTQRTGSVL